ncbi:UNVERIFIED_ORG: heme/copper-type cytochrome/quinol oxidase subunit 3 [Heyndrickxia coagulans]
MEIEQNFTAKTWPESPERATLEGRNKFLGFWLFLGGETVLFASLVCNLPGAERQGPGINGACKRLI